jgi:hypothetical protein
LLDGELVGVTVLVVLLVNGLVREGCSLSNISLFPTGWIRHFWALGIAEPSSLTPSFFLLLYSRFTSSSDRAIRSKSGSTDCWTALHQCHCHFRLEAPLLRSALYADWRVRCYRFCRCTAKKLQCVVWRHRHHRYIVCSLRRPRFPPPSISQSTTLPLSIVVISTSKSAVINSP